MGNLYAQKNLAYSLVATAPSPATTGTSLVVTAGQGTRFPNPATYGEYPITVWPANAIPTPANAEIMMVTAISTDTLTVTRNIEGTSARTVIIGDQIAMTITADVFAKSMQALWFTVSQASHGFTALDAIYNTGSAWAEAQSNSANTIGTHIVGRVIDTNTFIAVSSGRIEVASHGLTPGAYYFVSDATPGALTTTEPSTYSNPILFVESSSVVHILPYRAGAINEPVAAGSTGYIQFNDSGDFAADSALYWNNVNKRFGVGGVPERIMHIQGNQTGGIVLFERILSSTTGFVGTQIIKATSTGDMTDGFGATQTYTIEDTAGVENTVGDIGVLRDGGDARGKMVLRVWYDGSGEDVLHLKTAQNATNNFQMTPGATGVAPVLEVIGGDTNINMVLTPKGTGKVKTGGSEVVTLAAAQTLVSKTLTSAVLNTGVSGTAILDEDTMSSNSATQIPTQQSVKAYVDNHLSAGRNILINGNFDIWQRNTTFTFNDDTFGPDRWNLLTETNGAWTCARTFDTPDLMSTHSAQFTNVTANNQCAAVYLMENVDLRKLRTGTVSLSFSAKTNGSEIANLRATVLSWASTSDAVTSDVIGTWAQNGTDPTWATNWTAEVAGSNLALTADWVTYKIENIAIDTGSVANLAVVIWVDDGTITSGDDFFLAQVQLNAGAIALPFMPERFADEYQRCLRYYEKSYDYSVVPGTVTSAGSQYAVANGSANRPIWNIFYKVPKRTGASAVGYSSGTGASGNCRDTLAAADRTVGQLNQGTYQTTFFCSATPSANAGCELHFTVDAEL